MTLPLFIILHDFEMVTKTALDSGTRAYVLAAVSQDNLTCLATPLVVLYGAPTVRRRIEKLTVFKLVKQYWKKEEE